MILMPKAKPNPIPPVEMMVNVPEMVNVMMFTLRSVPVKVMVKPEGMTMEQAPEGTIPVDHVAVSSNAPDCLAV